MYFHVHAVSGFNQTSLVPFLPQEPSSNSTKPFGGKRSRYSPQEMSFSGDDSLANSRATCARNCGPSYHQCPKSSASNGAVRIGGTPEVGNLAMASAVMRAKSAACSRVRPEAQSG